LPTKHIVGFSGGIDSQAAARKVLNTYPKQNVILVNSDAGGNEHPITTEFVAWYSTNVHPVELITPIIADMWRTPGFAETKGYSGNAPLDFELMIKIKGRPPSRRAQFCTEKLKLIPQKRWLETHFGVGGQFEGWDYTRYSGVRRDESDKRASTPYSDWDEYFDCPIVCPIVDWTKQQCFDYVREHGEKINPLYTLGFNRVGCAPCINSGREDIRNWALRFPEMIDKLRGWERRTERTFFAPMVPGKYINSIDEVVEWAMCERGGKVKAAFEILERKACESKYGLCE